MPRNPDTPSRRLLSKSGFPRRQQFLFKLFFVALASLCSLPMSASAFDDLEKRPLEHEDYDRWNTLGARSISNDGRWIMYTVTPGKGNGTLKIREAASKREYSIVLGTGGSFTFDSKYAIYRVQPDPELIKKLRKEKKKAEELPKTKLEILELATGKKTTYESIRSFSVPQKSSGWIAVLLNKSPGTDTAKPGVSEVDTTFSNSPNGLQRKSKRGGRAKKKPSGKKSANQSASEKKKKKKSTSGMKPASGKQTKQGAANKKKSSGKKSASQKGKPGSKPTGTENSDKKKDDKKKTPGTSLVLRNLNSGMEFRFPHVVSYRFSKFGKRLAWATSSENPKEDGVFMVDLANPRAHQIIQGRGNYQSLVFDESETQLAFLSDRDDYDAKKPGWSLYFWSEKARKAAKVAAQGVKGIAEGWWLTSAAAPMFSEDGKRLFFSTAPIPEDVDEDKKDADAEPKAKLDVWHWQDPLLQPQQLLRAQSERNRSYRAVWNRDAKRVVQLATKEVPTVVVDPRSKSNRAVGIASDKYLKQQSWDFPGYQDVYLINLNNGKSELILEAVRGTPRLSPAGKFLSWYDSTARQWFAMSSRERKPINISAAAKVAFHNELHDSPSDPRPYGSGGWLAGDKGLVVYDRFDLWLLDPTGTNPPKPLTQGWGRKNHTRLRAVRLDREARSIDPAKPWLLSAFNEKTKSSGYYRMDAKSENAPKPLIQLDERISALTKAKSADQVIFTRSTFQRCADLWLSTLNFKEVKRISRLNPQQSEHTWGTVELVHWKSKEGKPLDGLLYKPEGFDPTKKYPMIVYFYERNSDNLHQYHTPAAGRSIINFSFYVSRGYLIFIPDIPYRTGYPGQSAANAVLPGVQHLIKQGFVDEKAIGTQGHSWGGYQVAYLVTQTNLFACAESGAPVSNMTSAYGGIRWGSGMSRMFQYEKTQSRIGAPLWEARQRYIENSPLFYADKITTPLLILHNDQDGAVPWYQGIELFVAMRRLSKPAWLLNYNGDPHWVMSRENRLDFATRMQQFFDHYLKGAPAPVWMTKGVPAVDKGKKFGLELDPTSNHEKPAAQTK